MTSIASTLRPAPCFMLTGGLLLWGWQNDFLLFSIIMATLLESSRIIRQRAVISDKEFNHVADASSILFLLTIIIVFNEKSVQGIYTLLSLLPFLFYPLILAQMYSSTGAIKPTALFISLRKLQNRDGQGMESFDISLPYLLLCIIAASAGNRQPSLFFIGICLLLGWTLWLLRPRRYAIATWFSLLILAFGFAYAGQAGIQNLHSMAASNFLEWFDRFMWRSRDPDRTSTAIGSIGKLKLSDRIMVRVQTTQPLEQPLLLRETSYSNYSYGVWANYNNTLLPVDSELNGNEWKINKIITPTESVNISFYLDDKAAIIPVPQGITTLYAEGATQLEASAYGMVRLEKHEGWARYKTAYVPGAEFDAEPDEAELELPSIYKADLEMIANDLGLHEKKPEEIIQTVKSWFADNFTYSLTQKQRYPRGKHLSKFLLQDRTGHCEFFATATALLLRTAGIPTRYVVGYSVQEYSPLEGQYIARASYAHSWAQAYVNNSWQIVDTTPSVWAPLEDENRTFIEPLIDLWSWLSYRFATLETDAGETNHQIYFYIAIVILVLILAWRLLRQPKNHSQRLTSRLVKNDVARQGMDSGFYRLLTELEKNLSPRKTGETLHTWLARTESPERFARLKPILELHYRYRFDPDSCNNLVRLRLDEQVDKLQIIN